jgi:DDE superfamily endonuclease
VDYQSRPPVWPKKGARDRLIRLAATHAAWALGFEDAPWWSRLARPSWHAWTDAGRPLRLIEPSLPKENPEPKALACYGLLVRWPPAEDPAHEEVWLRLVDGRPVSGITMAFLEWACSKLEVLGKKALRLVWDHASWHSSHQVEAWLKGHNRQAKEAGKGVRILPCPLPTRSPWLNPMEPRWVHAKRKVVEPERLLSAGELAQRVCDQFGAHHEAHLAIPEKVS